MNTLAPVRQRLFVAAGSFRPDPILALLIGQVLVWTWAGTVLRGNLDGPGDMVEAYAWGQDLQWGYFKHPPLSAWLAGAWFRLWPTTHWSYALLCSLVTAVGLLGVWRLARRFLPASTAWVAVAAVALTPGYTGLALRFNCNAVALMTWPWATVAALRLVERGRVRDALGLGLALALVILGKYFGAVLVAALVLASLVHGPWRAVWRRPAPYLAGVITLLLLLPHLHWLSSHPAPVQYAQAAAHAAGAEAPTRAWHFARAQLLYLLPAFVLLACALPGGRRIAGLGPALRGLFGGGSAPGLVALAWAPVLLTVVFTLLSGARTASVWGLPMAGPLVVLLMSRSDGQALDLPRARKLLGAVWLLVLLGAPAWWAASARGADAVLTEPREELALALAQAWRAGHPPGVPWRHVGGDPVLAHSAAFYAPEHPHYWAGPRNALETPWLDNERVQREGGLWLCTLDDAACQAEARAWGGVATRLEVHKSVGGHDFAPRAYQVYAWGS